MHRCVACVDVGADGDPGTLRSTLVPSQGGTNKTPALAQPGAGYRAAAAGTRRTALSITSDDTRQLATLPSTGIRLRYLHDGGRERNFTLVDYKSKVNWCFLEEMFS